jgi:hypothetical protein
MSDACAAPLRLEWIDPEQLRSNPQNIKFHPPEQLSALGDLVNDVGWAGALLFNEETGQLLDGHGRKELFAGKGPVPVLIGRWSPEQEKKVAAFLDPTGYMARIDSQALALLAGGSDLLALLAGDSPALKALALAVEQSAELLGAPEATAAASATDGAGGKTGRAKAPPAADVPDALWPSDNPFGVPVLDLSMQADAIEFPVTLWGTQPQTKSMRGTWTFYTADESFASLWLNPGKALTSGAPCLCEPNYSTHEQTPFAVELWGIYRRRWLARYWQSQGRRVFVDLNVHHRLLADHEATPGRAPAFLGVPRGWRAFCTRSHGNRPEMLEAEYAAAQAHSGCDSLLFLVYGGGVAVRDLCRARGWVWSPEQSDLVRGRFTDDVPATQPLEKQDDRPAPARARIDQSAQ